MREYFMKMNQAYEALRSCLHEGQLLRDESMKRHTSFRIGGPVDIMVIPKEISHIRHTIKVCKEFDIPFMVIGNGSNLLVRDGGIRGVVLKVAEGFNRATIEGETIRAESGILLSALSRLALGSNLTGLEFASGIPGTLGGAVVMNAGAYSGEMKDVVEWTSVLWPDGSEEVLGKEALQLGYRTSILQHTPAIVLEVFMGLKTGNYDTSKAMIAELTRRRQEKQPLSYPSAGSAFKRPVGYYAGKLIQDAGFKGMRVGDAQISELHSGFIINLGNASAQDVIALIEMITQKVKDAFDVDLSPEVRIVGE